MPMKTKLYREKINSIGTGISVPKYIRISITIKTEKFHKTTDKLFSWNNSKKLASSCFLIG
jgi:hypothetical protein